MKLLSFLQGLSNFLDTFHNSEEFNQAIADATVEINNKDASAELDFIVDDAINQVRGIIEQTIAQVKEVVKPTFDVQNEVSPEFLDAVASISTEFDASNDPFLMKQASVLDELLYTLAAPKNAFLNHKKAEEAEINKLREKAREATRIKDYEEVNKTLAEINGVANVQKAVKEQVKQFRPMEAPLSTRYCPDHPAAQMARVGENEYQCSLDKKVYNYEAGYTTMKGNEVPGGAVENQIPDYGDRSEGPLTFDTRESRTNSSI